MSAFQFRWGRLAIVYRGISGLGDQWLHLGDRVYWLRRRK